jgi:hypothetical protein
MIVIDGITGDHAIRIEILPRVEDVVVIVGIVQTRP